MSFGRRRGRFVVVLGFVAVSIGAWAPAAAAADDVDALIRKGVELRRQGKEREALEQFKRAAEAGKTPRAMGQMALAEQALGLWVQAEEHLKEALAAPNDAWVRKNRKTLDESLATISDRLGTLDVWGTPEGAEVQINGEAAGTLPATGSVRVTAGIVSVAVRAKGFTDSESNPGTQEGRVR